MTTLLRTALALAALGAATGVTAGADKKTKILLIGKDPDHPYGTHMYLHTCGVLGKCLELTPGVQTAVSNGWPKARRRWTGSSRLSSTPAPVPNCSWRGPT